MVGIIFKRVFFVQLIFFGLIGQSIPLCAMFSRVAYHTVPTVTRAGLQQIGRRVTRVGAKPVLSGVSPINMLEKSGVFKSKINGAAKKLPSLSFSSLPSSSLSSVPVIGVADSVGAKPSVSVQQADSWFAKLVGGKNFWGKSSRKAGVSASKRTNQDILSELRKIPCKNPTALPKTISIQEPLSCVQTCDGMPNCPKNLIEASHRWAAREPIWLRPQAIRDNFQHNYEPIAREIKKDFFSKLPNDSTLWTQTDRNSFAAADVKALVKKKLLFDASEGFVPAAKVSGALMPSVVSNQKAFIPAPKSSGAIVPSSQPVKVIVPRKAAISSALIPAQKIAGSPVALTKESVHKALVLAPKSAKSLIPAAKVSGALMPSVVSNQKALIPALKSSRAIVPSSQPVKSIVPRKAAISSALIPAQKIAGSSVVLTKESAHKALVLAPKSAKSLIPAAKASGALVSVSKEPRAIVLASNSVLKSDSVSCLKGERWAVPGIAGIVGAADWLWRQRSKDNAFVSDVATGKYKSEGLLTRLAQFVLPRFNAEEKQKNFKDQDVCAAKIKKQATKFAKKNIKPLKQVPLTEKLKSYIDAIPNFINALNGVLYYAHSYSGAQSSTPLAQEQELVCSNIGIINEGVAQGLTSGLLPCLVDQKLVDMIINNDDFSSSPPMNIASRGIWQIGKAFGRLFNWVGCRESCQVLYDEKSGHIAAIVEPHKIYHDMLRLCWLSPEKLALLGVPEKDLNSCLHIVCDSANTELLALAGDLGVPQEMLQNNNDSIVLFDHVFSPTIELVGSEQDQRHGDARLPMSIVLCATADCFCDEVIQQVEASETPRSDFRQTVTINSIDSVGDKKSKINRSAHDFDFSHNLKTAEQTIKRVLLTPLRLWKEMSFDKAECQGFIDWYAKQRGSRYKRFYDKMRVDLDWLTGIAFTSLEPQTKFIDSSLSFETAENQIRSILLTPIEHWQKNKYTSLDFCNLINWYAKNREIGVFYKALYEKMTLDLGDKGAF